MAGTEQSPADLDLAIKKAEEAATRAEKAATPPRYWLIGSLSLALVGAVLTFALRDSEAHVLGVSLQPLGGVLFAAGVLLVVAAALTSIGGSDGGLDSDGIKSVGGLIAVVTGITAVTALTIVTLTQLGSANKDSIVAVTSSAFGIISAVVGAYLGIKISSETTAKASNEAKAAAVSQHVAQVASNELAAVEGQVKDKGSEDLVRAMEAARLEAAERARPTDPPLGGGNA